MAQLKSTNIMGSLTVTGESTTERLNCVGDGKIQGILELGRTPTKDEMGEKNYAVGSHDLLDIFYPIGTIYTSTVANDSTLSVDGKEGCPIADTVGGQWQRIKGKFLWAAEDASSTYGPGSAGGSKDSPLIYHRHTTSGTTLYTDWAGTHSHSVTFNATAHDSWTDDCVRSANSGKGGKINVTRSTTTTGSHQHSVTIPTRTSNYTGYDRHIDNVAGTDLNMPPYLGVYVWKRIA